MAARKPKVAETDAPERKKKNAFNLPDDVLERARDVAYWDRVPLNQLIKDGLELEITRRAKRRGSEYPTRDTELKIGRPVKK